MTKLGKRFKKEIQEFVDSLTELVKPKSYISRECILNFTEDYLSNYDDPEYNPKSKYNMFVYMAAENGICWLSRNEIKKGKVCGIRNLAMVAFLNNEMKNVIKTGNYSFGEKRKK